MWKTRVSLVHLFGEENATAGRAQDKVGGVTGTLMQSRTQAGSTGRACAILDLGDGDASPGPAQSAVDLEPASRNTLRRGPALCLEVVAARKNLRAPIGEQSLLCSLPGQNVVQLLPSQAAALFGGIKPFHPGKFSLVQRGQVLPE